jgi:hypothetical protein
MQMHQVPLARGPASARNARCFFNTSKKRCLVAPPVFCAARSSVFLILLSVRIKKKEYNTEHDAPVGLADAQLDDLVNSDHQEHYREGE